MDEMNVLAVLLVELRMEMGTGLGRGEVVTDARSAEVGPDMEIGLESEVVLGPVMGMGMGLGMLMHMAMRGRYGRQALAECVALDWVRDSRHVRLKVELHSFVRSYQAVV